MCAPNLLRLSALLSLASLTMAYTAVFLFEISAYNEARQCVQECAVTYSNYGVNKLGCAYNVGVATCLCSNNVGQSSYMSSWYSSCALSSCSDEQDASTAVQIFADYCQANIDANAPLSVPASTTAASAAAGSYTAASPGGTSATVTGNGDGNGNGSGSGSGNGNGNSGNNDGNTTNNYNSGATVVPPKLVVQGLIMMVLLSLTMTL